MLEDWLLDSIFANEGGYRSSGCKDLSPVVYCRRVEKSKRMAPLVSGTALELATDRNARKLATLQTLVAHRTPQQCEMRMRAHENRVELTSRSTSKAAAAGRGYFPNGCPSRNTVC